MNVNTAPCLVAVSCALAKHADGRGGQQVDVGEVDGQVAGQAVGELLEEHAQLDGRALVEVSVQHESIRSSLIS